METNNLEYKNLTEKFCAELSTFTKSEYGESIFNNILEPSVVRGKVNYERLIKRFYIFFNELDEDIKDKFKNVSELALSILNYEEELPPVSEKEVPTLWE